MSMERIIQNFNRGWYFHKNEEGSPRFYSYEDLEFSYGMWENVVIPHTPHIEPIEVYNMWQGLCWYYKKFVTDRSYEGKKVFIQFDGAMTAADVWINGRHMIQHLGGYLPFVIDVTGVIKYDDDNLIVVRLNNEDNEDVPPGRPIKKLDFYWYGGLYRNVTLYATDYVYITNPIHANKTASGGVFVTYPQVTEEKAIVNISTHIANEYMESAECRLYTRVMDSAGKVIVDEWTQPVIIKNKSDYNFEQNLVINHPILWHPHSPSLYTVESIVINNGVETDIIITKIGIRTISITKENGFKINGKKLFLRGANYHQEYPYVGYAVSDNAHYRNALKIKNAGFDYVRLSHYPHSPEFMDACDELGLIVMNCIPGWQFMGGEQFKELSYQNCRELIRRDRNHPCVVMWELSLNETDMDIEFMQKAHEVGHQEYPGDQFYTCGWFDTAYDVFIGNAGHGDYNAQGTEPYYYLNPDMSEKVKENRGMPCIVSEYGDWEFGGEESTSRQLRRAGEKELLVQCCNFIKSHNKNLSMNVFGDGLWVMCDYKRGMSPKIESSGILDIFRIPKFSYYFFKSQRDAELRVNKEESGPTVYIANYWTPESPTDVLVFSNCEEVELYLDGQMVAKQQPDCNENTEYLNHPPFTFKISEFHEGELKAVGFIAGKAQAEHSVGTPGEPYSIDLEFGTEGCGFQAGIDDMIFVYAKVIDKNGNIVYGYDKEVAFEIKGPCSIIGPNSIKAEAGIAAILIKAGDCKDDNKVTVSAKTVCKGRVMEGSACLLVTGQALPKS